MADLVLHVRILANGSGNDFYLFGFNLKFEGLLADLFDSITCHIFHLYVLYLIKYHVIMKFSFLFNIAECILLLTCSSSVWLPVTRVVFVFDLCVD